MCEQNSTYIQDLKMLNTIKKNMNQNVKVSFCKQALEFIEAKTSLILFLFNQMG